MTQVAVHISSVKDGSMYNRADLFDSSVLQNRKSFLTKFDIQPTQTTRLSFVYGTETSPYCRYAILDSKHKGLGMNDDASLGVDAVVTSHKGHALLLPVADCVGTVLYDPDHQVLMLSHLGRHSLEQYGGIKSVDFLVKNFDSDPSQLRVWLTPAAGKGNYSIWALDNKGMKEASLEQLLEAGIMQTNIIDNSADTTTDKSYYSYSEFLKGNRAEDGDHAIVAMMTD